jgi:hypothetical protein
MQKTMQQSWKVATLKLKETPASWREPHPT